MGSSHLTTKEAAIKMGVPLRTIQSMIQDGRLKAERIGRASKREYWIYEGSP